MPAFLMAAAETFTVHDLLPVSAVRVDLPGEDKATVLTALVDLLKGQPGVKNLAMVREDVLAREAIMSTGVGKGLALPHARTEAVDRTVAAFAVTRQPIDFESIDEEPVRLLFLLVGPEQERTRHIKWLSRVSRLMNDDAFRARLLKAPSAEAILTVFQHAEDE